MSGNGGEIRTNAEAVAKVAELTRRLAAELASPTAIGYLASYVDRLHRLADETDRLADKIASEETER